MPETRGRGTGSTALTARRWREMRWMSSGSKPETGEPGAWKRASTVREGAERNVLKGNALAAYFTKRMAQSRARWSAMTAWLANTQTRQLTELYRALRLYVNCFQPLMKLLSKQRDGKKCGASMILRRPRFNASCSQEYCLCRSNKN